MLSLLWKITPKLIRSLVLQFVLATNATTFVRILTDLLSQSRRRIITMRLWSVKRARLFPLIYWNSIKHCCFHWPRSCSCREEQQSAVPVRNYLPSSNVGIEFQYIRGNNLALLTD